MMFDLTFYNRLIFHTTYLINFTHSLNKNLPSAMRMQQEFLYPKKRRKRRKRRKRKEKKDRKGLSSVFGLILSVLILSDIHIGLVTMHQRF